MKNKSLAMLASLALAAPLSALANPALLVQVPATLDPAAPIAASVRAECGVEQLVGNHVLGAVGSRVPGTQAIVDPRQAGATKVLRLTLVSVSGVGGGGWSGPKGTTVRVDLVQQGKVLATTVLTRNSRGGFWGGTSGTCAILERVAVALGKDVAAWAPHAIAGRIAPAPAPEPAAEDAHGGHQALTSR